MPATRSGKKKAATKEKVIQESNTLANSSTQGQASDPVNVIQATNTIGAANLQLQEEKAHPKGSRSHLPTQAELKRSFELIKQWNDELSVVDLKLVEVKKMFRDKLAAVDEVFDDRLEECRRQFMIAQTNIRRELGEAHDKIEMEMKDVLAPVQAMREEIKNRLDGERIFASPVRRMPQEIIGEIFHQVTKGEIPSRQLALVCRRWKTILLDTPSLWHKLHATFITGPEVLEKTTQLQRRIDLSRSTVLEVTFQTSNYSIVCNKPDLFQAVAKTDIGRWRALTLAHDIPDLGLAPISAGLPMAGQFTSLQNLTLIYQDALDPFSSIGRLIVQSQPPIKSLCVVDVLPDIFADPHVFQYVECLSGNPTAMQELRGLDSLLDLNAQEPYPIEFDAAVFPPLPARCQFYSISRTQLSRIQVAKVRYLMVTYLEGAPIEVIQLPEVTTLKLKTSSLIDTQKIMAPKLKTLSLEGKAGSYSLRNKESAEITTLFKSTANPITIRPTTLSLFLSMTTSSLMLVLQTWSQLENLTLSFDKFTTKGAFANGLIKKKAPLLPNLVTLHLDSASEKFDEDIYDWEETVKTTFQLRKNLPLRLVKWRHRRDLADPSRPWKRATSDDWYML